MKIAVNDWVVICADGLWASPFEIDKFAFKSKKSAIEEIQGATMDARKTPKVKKIVSGNYEYFPKDCDYGTYNDSYNIRKVTKENISDLLELIEEVDNDCDNEEER